MSQSHGIFREALGVHGPLWVVSRYNVAVVATVDWLTLEISGLGRVLPIFSSSEDANTFLRGTYHREARRDLRASRTGRMQLASALSESPAVIDRVAFDPLPEPDLEQTAELASLGRTAFLDLMLGRGRAWSAGSGRERPFSRHRREGVIRA